MGARAQVITTIKIEECPVVPFFVVHRQWAEGTDILLEVLDIVSFVYSHRGYFNFTPITIDLWRDTFSYYDKNNDSDAFYSGFKSLMRWYEIDIS